MSDESKDTPITAVNDTVVKAVEPAAGEPHAATQTAPRVAQPFKLPYSNEFEVEFKSVHTMKEDRIYSEPVVFGPLKWCVFGQSTN
jgi:hypothetical protein